jgi:hypothetical protein
LIHITDHYEKQNFNISQWSHSLVVKGLLKQVYANFNIAAAWKKLIGPPPNGDRLIEWSRHNAATLKHSLEFHDRSVEDVAAQALKLATKASLESSHIPWASTGSRETILTSPIGLLGFDLENWTEAGMIAPYPAAHTPGDIEMADSGISYI